MRILIANDPRAYREVIAGAFRAILVDAEVAVVEPDELDAAIVELEPHVVLCSRLSEVVETRSLAWIVLYPEGRGLAELSIAGQRTRTEGIGFDALLTLVAEAKNLAHSG